MLADAVSSICFTIVASSTIVVVIDKEALLFLHQFLRRPFLHHPFSL